MPVEAPSPLPCDQLRWTCDPSWVDFNTTDDIEPILGVIGQEPAVDALRFGLATSAPGHHVFVRGLAGTGRVSLVRSLMERIHPACPVARDRCFVRNFEQPDRPRMLSLRRGRGRAFVRLMDEIADFIRDRLKRALDADVLQRERKALQDGTEARLREQTGPFEKELRSAGLSMVAIEIGPATQTRIAPLVEGEPVPPEALESLVEEGKLPAEEADRLRAAVEQFSARLAEITARLAEIRRDFQREELRLVERQVRTILVSFLERVQAEFDAPEVHEFVAAVIDDLAQHRLHDIQQEEDFTRLYRVNLVVHHDPGTSCPVVTEITPSLPNLLGTIDHELSRTGDLRSDHLMIHAGALLRADGGFLLLEARDLLSEPGAWKVLVRTLRTGRLEIVPPELSGPWIARSVRPEPVDINVKVILVGDAETFHLLDQLDPDFPQLFKVLADFETSIARTRASAGLYAGVLAKLVRKESLPAFESDAVARLIEYGARVAGDRGRLTARFGRIGDIAREAAFVAREHGEGTVSGARVLEAVARTKRRADLPARRYRDLIADGTIRVEVSGREVGQINGLAVVHAGPLVYGFPQRITATVAPGGGGTVSIDREADLSGAIHTKGFYILAGLLRALLQPAQPLAFEASIAFEQSYGGIDGDSASAAEMVCLLSALTGIPVRQDLALTGAIDQRGQVMAIGAVNEKVEGFHDTCAAIELTGTQGCIIPRTNVTDLMLRGDVAEACAQGRFHVYAVSTIHEALALLLDREAGAPDETTGAYPEGTILAEARARARSYWERSRPADGDGKA